MKYSVGQELEYNRKDKFVIKIIATRRFNSNPYYKCEVIEGPRCIGKIWDKSEDYLDGHYTLISKYHTQKNKLKI